MTETAKGRFTRTYRKPGVGDRPMPLKNALGRYRVMVEDNARQSRNDPESTAPPMLWVAGPDDLIVMLCTMSPDGDPVVQLKVIAYGITHDQLPRPDWVAYFAEGWSTISERRGDLDELKKNELHDRWKIGMSGIGEAVVGQMIHRDGRGWSVAQRFDRVALPTAISWQEAMENPFQPEGNVPKWLEIMVGRKEWDSDDDPA